MIPCEKHPGCVTTVNEHVIALGRRRPSARASELPSLHHHPSLYYILSLDKFLCFYFSNDTARWKTTEFIQLLVLQQRSDGDVFG